MFSKRNSVRGNLGVLALAILGCSAAICGKLSAAPTDFGDVNWWRTAVIYQVYPRSFGDSNGDGIGDLNGVTEHLDYLKALGVDAVWLTPFFPSPQVDFGYDVSDFRGIDPQFGTMADFDRLVEEARKRNIRIVADMVLNHSSDQHPWFIESKSSRTNPKADWYAWSDGKNGHPPNNWLSLFGGSAWQYVPARKQFYYHRFYKEQPDFNWNNRELRNAMYDVCRFWMKKGVYGLRLDALTSVFESPGLEDEPYAGGLTDYGDRAVTKVNTENIPKVHEVLKELRKVSDEFPGRVLIGETYLNDTKDLLLMYGMKNEELQMPMDFQLGFLNEMSVPKFRKLLVDAETKLNGNTPTFVFDNHDNPRSWNRYGDGKHDAAIARLVATMLLTPRDSALIYYGQEIGMVDHEPTSKDQVQDPKGKTGWPKDKGRDGERTPMQWNAGPQAGFSNNPATWLPVGSDYKRLNVAAQEKDPQSLLNYYKQLIKLRKTNGALRDGEFIALNVDNNSVLSYIRKSKGGEAVLVAMNCTAQPQKISYDLSSHGLKSTRAKRLLASYPTSAPSVDVKAIELPPFGSFVGQVD